MRNITGLLRMFDKMFEAIVDVERHLEFLAKYAL